MPITKLTAIILTRDEERDLPGCLESVAPVATSMYVVDSWSTDRTVEIARQFGANVLVHEFENQAAQFNWALQQIDAADWVLRIDADERLSAALQNSIRSHLHDADSDLNGLEMARRVVFLGRTIRHGDSYPVWLLRLWRYGRGQVEERWMDEHIELTGGRVERLTGDLLHVIPKSLDEWITKHNSYASRECMDMVRHSTRSGGPAGHASVRRHLKVLFYARLPPFWRCALFWFYRYVCRLGFLDGRSGMIYHYLHAFWYRFLVDAKFFEMDQATERPGAKHIRHSATK